MGWRGTCSGCGRARPRTFRFSFGLDELPQEPGVILVRGPRQYGKSTWLELMLRDTVEDHGPGSAYILNCDELTDAQDLERHFVNLSVALAFAPNRMASIEEFKSLPSPERARWLKWLVAQELFRRQAIAGVEDPEAIWYWASREHEVDFVDHGRRLYEVKVGRTGPLDFAWFPRTFPGAKLLVIGADEFETLTSRGSPSSSSCSRTDCRIRIRARSTTSTCSTTSPGSPREADASVAIVCARFGVHSGHSCLEDWRI